MLEAENILDSRSAEPVDRLVVVTDYAEILMTLRKQGHKPELRLIGVLILVHHNVLIKISVMFKHVRLFLEKLHGKADYVVEIQSVGVPQTGLVKPIELCYAHFAVIPLSCVFKLVRVYKLILSRGDHAKHHSGRKRLI